MTLHKIIANVKIKTKLDIMNTSNNKLTELNLKDCRRITGGGWPSVLLGAAALIVTCAAALGYYDGKQDCLPPPCK
jgi:hypothetical protein